MTTKGPRPSTKKRPKPKPTRCAPVTTPRSKRPLKARRAKLVKAYVETGSVTRAAEQTGWNRSAASRALSRQDVRETLQAEMRRQGIDEQSIVARLLGLADGAADVERDEDGATVKTTERAAVRLGAVRVLATMLVPDQGPRLDELDEQRFSPVAAHGFDRVQRLALALLSMDAMPEGGLTADHVRLLGTPTPAATVGDTDAREGETTSELVGGGVES